MDIVEKAIIFAVNAHSGQLRKGKDRPYIIHPITACEIACSITSDREVIAAAVLHDCVEDTSVTANDIRHEFGERVERLVASDSEDKMEHIPASESWKVRKQATLDFLDSATRDEQIICLADKLANVRELYRDYVEIGDKLWERFNQKDKNMHAWYYRGIAERLNFLTDTIAYNEYIYLLDKVFG